MEKERYTFPLAYIHPHIYAIAGRAYGSKKESIHNQCERFSLLTK
jgi:myosin heavy subunit